MKQIYIIILCMLCLACTTNLVADGFEYKEIITDNFRLYSYQKILSSNKPIKIYIEGDGHAFNFHGQPTNDPTPKSNFLKKIALSDTNSNVVYLARPCQYILNKNAICSKRHWTTARFAPEIIHSMASAIKQIANNRPVVLIGYSGGAQIAGLVAVLNPDIKIKKIITIAGNLDHSTWTQYHNLPNLSESLNLGDYHTLFKNIPQKHYVGLKDSNITYELLENFIQNKSLIIQVNEASHNYGWEQIIPEIIAEN